MKACIDSDEKGYCYRCGRACRTEKHHIFGGPNRKLSEKYGLVVHLCHACHNEPPEGAHFSKDTADWLHRIGQQAFEVSRNKEGMEWDEARAEFIKTFGKNYLN